jgi:hypothetical protein
MKVRRLVAVAALGLAAIDAFAAEPASVRICYDYGCKSQDDVMFDESTFAIVDQMLRTADDAVSERYAVAAVVARLYVEAGRQTPIWHDHGGDAADEGIGSMDCVDHATNTTTFLRLLEGRGLLRFHQVGGTVKRGFFAEHWSAQLIEVPAGTAYAVDSWYYELGMPAVVMPLSAWRAGQRPPGIMTGFR